MGGLFSKEKERDRAREESAKQGLLAGLAIEAVDHAKARQEAAEQSRLAVFGMLGAPGSYDLPGAASGQFTPGQVGGDIYDTDSARTDKSAAAKGMLKYGHKTGQAGMDLMYGKRTGILDPKKYAKEVAKSGSFRVQSRLTAEAEQLLAKEGEAWQKLDQATRGQIFEGAATALRESMREIKNNAAKGGSARRAALTEANKILAIERTNQIKINETWQANIRLDEYVRQNAMAVQDSNNRFLDNLPGIRDNYNNTMNSLAEMMASVAIPVASAATEKSYAARNAVKEPQILEKLIVGVVGGVLSQYTGGQNPLAGLVDGGGGAGGS